MRIFYPSTSRLNHNNNLYNVLFEHHWFIYLFLFCFVSLFLCLFVCLIKGALFIVLFRESVIIICFCFFFRYMSSPQLYLFNILWWCSHYICIYIFIYLFNLGIIMFVCLFVFRGAVTLVDWLVCLYLCVLSQVYYLIIIIICLLCHLFPVSGRYYHSFIHL